MRHLRALVQHRKIFWITLSAEIADRCAKAAHLAPATHLQHPRQTFFQPIDHHPPVGWHGAQQMVELPLDGLQVVKNVSVVEFQVVQDGGARAVMDKLAALIKKSGVVFVRLDHKGGPAPKAGRHGKIQRYAAHQKTRLQTRMFQNPAEHSGGRGFAVGPGNRQHMAPG